VEPVRSANRWQDFGATESSAWGVGLIVRHTAFAGMCVGIETIRCASDASGLSVTARGERVYRVYVVELDDRAGVRRLPDKPTVYVGQTGDPSGGRGSGAERRSFT